jgi:hypothetical protein
MGLEASVVGLDFTPISSSIFVSVILLIQNCLRSVWGVAHVTYDPVTTWNFTYDRSDMRSSKAQLSHTGNIIILDEVFHDQRRELGPSARPETLSTILL